MHALFALFHSFSRSIDRSAASTCVVRVCIDCVSGKWWCSRSIVLHVRVSALHWASVNFSPAEMWFIVWRISVHLLHLQFSVYISFGCFAVFVWSIPIFRRCHCRVESLSSGGGGHSSRTLVFDSFAFASNWFSAYNFEKSTAHTMAAHIEFKCISAVWLSICTRRRDLFAIPMVQPWPQQ